jgi:hypothetical protein
LKGNKKSKKQQILKNFPRDNSRNLKKKRKKKSKQPKLSSSKFRKKNKRKRKRNSNPKASLKRQVKITLQHNWHAKN